MYLFADATGRVLYVGKAKDLRRRLAGYRNASRRKAHRKMRTLVRAAASLEVRPQLSETQALLLENELIRTLRPPYNVGALNAEATLFALEHADEFAAQAAVLRAERERLQHALRGLPGAMPFPSEANMILVRVPDAAAAFAGMKARGVLVKNVSALHPLLKNCLRLTVGTPEENTLMIDALKASL